MKKTLKKGSNAAKLALKKGSNVAYRTAKTLKNKSASLKKNCKKVKEVSKLLNTLKNQAIAAKKARNLGSYGIRKLSS